MERVRNWPTPQNHDDVLRFLGLIQYLAHFMPNVAAYTSPLSAICANRTPFHWRPMHDKCFEMIKALAAKAPILRPIDVEKPDPIWVVCDASKTGVGAYYGQGPDWKTCCPAGFMSKSLPMRNSVRCVRTRSIGYSRGPSQMGRQTNWATHRNHH